MGRRSLFARHHAGRTCTAKLVLFTAAALTGASAADAAPRNQEDREDPRRSGGARVTQEVNAGADKANQNDSNRMAQSYLPDGIELGSFLLLPKVELDTNWNSNIFAEERDRDGDWVATVRPQMRLRSRWREHELNFRGQLESTQHARFSRDNVTDGLLQADGTYQLNRTDELNAIAEAFSIHEERGSNDDARGEKPTQTRGGSLRLGSVLQSGSWALRSQVAAQRLTFGNVATSTGATVYNHDRDRDEYEASLRGSYEFFPAYAAVVSVTGNKRSYDDARDDLGFRRDSKGYRVEAGLGVDLTDLIRGDFLVGYLQQNYDDVRFRDPKGFAMRASFNWTPSKLTVVVPTIERTVTETTLAQVSGIIRTAGSLLVRHEYARNVILSGYAGIYHDKFKSLGGSALTWETRARATYAFTQNLFLSGELMHRDKDSDIRDASFKQNVISLRIGYQL